MILVWPAGRCGYQTVSQQPEDASPSSKRLQVRLDLVCAGFGLYYI